MSPLAWTLHFALKPGNPTPTTPKDPEMNAIRNLRIGQRLTLAFGMILLILATSAGVGVWRLQELAETTRAMGTTENEKLKLAVQWRQTIDLNWIRTRAALLDSDTNRLAAWQAEMEKTSETTVAARKVVERLVQSDEGRKMLADIDKAREAYRTPREQQSRDHRAQLAHQRQRHQKAQRFRRSVALQRVIPLQAQHKTDKEPRHRNDGQGVVAQKVHLIAHQPWPRKRRTHQLHQAGKQPGATANVGQFRPHGKTEVGGM